MLRTRRRDNNVKPNRRDATFKSRLDRKSSRGMLYENEELRLKTININAEIERGQSDIKKLKRENEMLKKEIWCLRDEYDKLDKLLKDKKIDFSSSSTTYSSSSETESCSSCTEESEEVETSQNMKNVQKTNLKNIHDQFDHLSIVTEETSCDNSDRNSTNTRQSLANDQSDNMLWNYNDKNAIKPDQSYPVYGSATQPNRSQTLPNQMHFNCFAPIQHSKSFDDNHFSQVHEHQPPLYPEDLYAPPMSCRNNGESQTPPIAISPSPPPLYENQRAAGENFLSKKIVQTNATNFHQNVVLGPKKHLQPPEARALDKKATDLIVKIDNQNFSKALTYSNTTPSTTFSNGGNLEELLHDIESISQDILKLSDLQRGLSAGAHQPPPLAEDNAAEVPALENERALTDSEERLHKSELNVVLMPKAMPLIGFDKYRNIQRSLESLNAKPLEPLAASQQNLCADTTRPALRVTLPGPPQAFHADSNSAPSREEHNPFFFGNLNDNYVNSDYFSRRYNPDNFINKEELDGDGDGDGAAPMGDNTEENIKLKKKEERAKSPKMSITRKVSIHFKGKKEKERLKKLALDCKPSAEAPKPSHQKTPSIESKKSTTETSNCEPKTPNSSESDKKKEKKGRKSVSVSPERGRHVHMQHDGLGAKKHKKHRRERSGGRARRGSMDPRLRERSFSVCTDRSLGPGGALGSFLYEEYSDRERTNSGSSCDSHENHRKFSGISNAPLNGKLPWCGCWGNGCL